MRQEAVMAKITQSSGKKGKRKKKKKRREV
jgi:hypothetical protein